MYIDIADKATFQSNEIVFPLLFQQDEIAEMNFSRPGETLNTDVIDSPLNWDYHTEF